LVAPLGQRTEVTSAGRAYPPLQSYAPDVTAETPWDQREGFVIWRLGNLATGNPDQNLRLQIAKVEITQSPIFYDLASRQSRIPFAIRQKRESRLPSFGQKLKLEREKRKITLEQISVSTKIGIRMLQALEEDNFNQLPGGIFNKGFVRAYSRFVGLDEDQTIADYLQASGDALPVSPESAAHGDGSRENAATHEGAARENRNKDQERVSRLEASADAPPRQVPWGVFAGALLVVALALSFWSHRRREHASEAVRPTPATPAAQVSDGASVSDLPTTSSPTNGSPTGVPAPSVVPKTSHDLAPASPAATSGEFTVVIQAREESWTTITADGKTISSELLPTGSERVVRGQKEITVRTGNAGGVDFRFNGKKLDTGGDYGEVKTVTFGPRGVLSSSPAPPSTP
jgi:cytoskeleton protein RodZ